MDAHPADAHQKAHLALGLEHLLVVAHLDPVQLLDLPLQLCQRGSERVQVPLAPSPVPQVLRLGLADLGALVRQALFVRCQAVGRDQLVFVQCRQEGDLELAVDRVGEELIVVG